LAGRTQNHQLPYTDSPYPTKIASKAKWLDATSTLPFVLTTVTALKVDSE